MTEPRAILLDCTDYCKVRIVKGKIGFDIEEYTKDAMGVSRWTNLACLTDGDYAFGNKDHRFNDIPGWVFYAVSRLFDIETFPDGPAKEEK